MVGAHRATGGQSLELWSVIRDSGTERARRSEAFERMLDMSFGGWWGQGSLMLFVKAVAFGKARRRLAAFGLPADAIDHEGIAHDALLELFKSAAAIKAPVPTNWLIGTVGNLIAKDIRERYLELTADDVSEQTRIVDPEVASREDEQVVRLYKALLRAIRDLNPPLQAVAILLWVERSSRKEICNRLEISPETLRKRIERMKVALRKRFQLESLGTSPAKVQDLLLKLTKGS